MGILDSVDLNTAVCNNGDYISYVVYNSCTNKPATDGYILIYKWPTGPYMTQIFFDPNNDATYMRSTDGEGTWNSWVRNDNYGTTSLSGLASALGTLGVNHGQLIQQKVGLLTSIDANDCQETGFYYLYQGCQNTPSEYFIMFSIKYGSLDIIQIGVGLLTLKLYVRAYTGNGWSEWSEK